MARITSADIIRIYKFWPQLKQNKNAKLVDWCTKKILLQCYLPKLRLSTNILKRTQTDRHTHVQLTNTNTNKHKQLHTTHTHTLRHSSSLSLSNLYDLLYLASINGRLSSWLCEKKLSRNLSNSLEKICFGSLFFNIRVFLAKNIFPQQMVVLPRQLVGEVLEFVVRTNQNCHFLRLP